MSYDYTLVSKPRSIWKRLGARFGGEMGRMMALFDAMEGHPIGTIEETKQRIIRVFPSLSWEKTNFPGEIEKILAALPGDVKDWSWSAVGEMEITLGADSLGNVRGIRMSRAERREVKRLAKALNLYAFDEQSEKLFGG